MFVSLLAARVAARYLVEKTSLLSKVDGLWRAIEVVQQSLVDLIKTAPEPMDRHYTQLFDRLSRVERDLRAMFATVKNGASANVALNHYEAATTSVQKARFAVLALAEQARFKGYLGEPWVVRFQNLAERLEEIELELRPAQRFIRQTLAGTLRSPTKHK